MNTKYEKLRFELLKLRTEINCRLEHGGESMPLRLLQKMMDEILEEPQPLPKGTRIRLLRPLVMEASAGMESRVYGRAGRLGRVDGVYETDEGLGYWISLDGCSRRLFGTRPGTDFEVVEAQKLSPFPVDSTLTDYRPPSTGHWPDPTPEMLECPEFNAIWNSIKRWDIGVPGTYSGHCGATGNHVRAILDALRSLKPVSVPPGNFTATEDHECEITATRSTSFEAGSCNGCSRYMTSNGVSLHRVTLVHLKTMSFMLCPECRVALLQKLQGSWVDQPLNE